MDNEIELTKQDYRFIKLCREIQYGTLLEIDIREGQPLLVKKGYKTVRFDIEPTIDRKRNNK